jgi:hypothetical protein
MSLQAMIKKIIFKQRDKTQDMPISRLINKLREKPSNKNNKHKKKNGMNNNNVKSNQ